MEQDKQIARIPDFCVKLWEQEYSTFIDGANKIFIDKNGVWEEQRDGEVDRYETSYDIYIDEYDTKYKIWDLYLVKKVSNS